MEQKASETTEKDAGRIVDIKTLPWLGAIVLVEPGPGTETYSFVVNKDLTMKGFSPERKFKNFAPVQIRVLDDTVVDVRKHPIPAYNIKTK